MVIVHEAAHAWFNDALLTGRWISEGLADAYAARALARLGSTPPTPEPPIATRPSPSRSTSGRRRTASTARPPRRARPTATTPRGKVIDALRRRDRRRRHARGPGRGRRPGSIAYPGRRRPERQTNVADFRDWRYLLDLLEQAAARREAAELFETWVVSDAERPLLDDHERVVRRYASWSSDADGWLPA